MAGDAARLRADSARLRRVVAGRAFQRLLVLGGLLIAGWLLGCAAQSAHAEEMPVTRVVAKTPVLGDAVETVHKHEPVRRVVRAVAEKSPEIVKVTPDAEPLPVVPDVREAAHEGRVPAVSATGSVSEAHGVPEAQERVRAVSKVARTASAVGGPVAQKVVQHHPVPFHAPDRPDGNAPAGASALHGVTAGFPNVVAWAPAPPRASDARLFGAVPPAVRTAADEPSFAPD
ncbi:hypothetical protein [Spirillospora sp. NPDC048819]|uniref:hypothetical protein n=1 Tax=Spirillospora sp. NPDC048819 TaxID=3155268 RepID=UPI0033F0C5D3